MRLTLFVPDLFWPDADDAAAFDFPGATALAEILARAWVDDTSLAATDSWESRLADCFGLSAPLAALRWLGEANAPPLPADAGSILCADPVNLDFIQQAMVLSPIADLNAADTTALLNSLNAEFANEGHFVAGKNDEAKSENTTARWYFIAHAHSATTLPNLAAASRLAGRRIDADESRALLGRDGLRWLNRIQMCLTAHPVNQAHETAGLPLINSLWPWGLGTMPTGKTPQTAQAAPTETQTPQTAWAAPVETKTSQTIQPETVEAQSPQAVRAEPVEAQRLKTQPPETHILSSAFDRAIGNTPLLNGLCHVTQTPLAASGSFADAQHARGDTLMVNLAAHTAISQDDLPGWQTAISALAADWLTPALTALNARRLQTITLISVNAHRQRVWTLHCPDRSLWRRLLRRLGFGQKKTPPLAELVRKNP